MAGIDYMNCSLCGKRLIYDGDWKVREAIEEEVACGTCVERLQKKIEKLKKHDRRKH